MRGAPPPLRHALAPASPPRPRATLPARRRPPAGTVPAATPPALASTDDVDMLVAALAADSRLDSDEVERLLAPVARAAAPAAPPPRGPAALLLARLNDALAPPPGAASAILQSLDDDDVGDALSSGGGGSSSSAAALEAVLADLCASAFDRADAARVGRLSAADLAAMLACDAKSGKVERVMRAYGRAPSAGGPPLISYAGFLRLLRDEADDLRAVLRYAQVERGGGGGASAAVAAPPPAAPPLPAVRLRPGEVTMIFGGDDLDAVVAAAPPGSLVVVQAGFTWCKPCKAFAPTYAALAGAYAAVTFVKFHGNSNDRTKALFKERLRAKETPAFAFLRDGKPVAPLVAGANAGKLIAALGGVLAPAEDPLAGAPEIEVAAFAARLPGGVGGAGARA
jgi:thioredoxin 1